MQAKMIKPAKKVNFTVKRIAEFKCPEGIPQAFLWCNDPKGLAIRATAKGKKTYIYQTKIKGKSARLTIGEVGHWKIPAAVDEACRLQVEINQGHDPRQVRAAKEAEQEAEAAEQNKKRITESVTVAEAWQAYVAERSVAIEKGKHVWGERHKAAHAYFTQAGGKKRTRGRRPGESVKTKPGILVPLMAMRLIDIDETALARWLEKEASKAPTAAALAFRLFRAFLAWCAKQKEFNAAVVPGVCQLKSVKNKVPEPQEKNDCLRKAQIKPWFAAVHKIGNPVISAYLQGLLLTGARRNELAALRWADVDFQWKTLTIRDKVAGKRTIPLTPYLEHLIYALPRRNEFVFSSPTAASKRLEEPRNPHNAALATAGLPALSLHGLRRSFRTLAEWAEVPAGVAAQIMGHKPSALVEKHYIKRDMDFLHKWHVIIETWFLEQAEIQFVPVQAGLRVVA